MKNFAFGAASPPPGHIAAPGSHAYAQGGGHGWIARRAPRDEERRNTDSALRSTTLSRAPARFLVELPPGRYLCTFAIGDLKGVPRATAFSISGQEQQLPLILTDGARFIQAAVSVQLREGPLEICFSSPEGVWAVNSLKVEPLAADATPVAGIRPLLEDRWNLPAETSAGARTMLRDWQDQIAGDPPPAATGLTSANYLDRVESCVDFFLAHQAPDGAIIDPYRQVEFQYSTPCFAYAAALAAVGKQRGDLLAPALSAFRHAAKALGTRTAADRHEDFYPAPLAHAYRLLARAIPAAELDAAADPLRHFDPYRTYRKPPGGSKRSGSNWNCKALAGHHMLRRLGLAGETDYVDHSLLRQGLLFNNEFGLYAEGPATYDSFPRAWLCDMLSWGYDGAAKANIEEALWRGAITSLFMQSPSGEAPTGGRSSLHQWADALQCVIFEWGAGRAAASGQNELAGTFRRAARRALAALNEWVRPSGEFWIVKNRFDPAERHGFEVYSSHSQYNLLAVTALGFAHELANEAGGDRQENWTPAERGTHWFHVGHGIDRLFACAEGTQVEIATVPTPFQTPRGIIRVQMKNAPSQLPMMDGVPSEPMFHLPGAGLAVAMGPAWLTDEGEGSLAASLGVKVQTTCGEISRDRSSLVVEVNYAASDQNGGWNVTERIALADQRMHAHWQCSPAEQKWTLRWPMFLSDGEHNAAIAQNGRQISASLGGSTVTFRGPERSYAVLKSDARPYRAGMFRTAQCAMQDGTADLLITCAPGQASPTLDPDDDQIKEYVEDTQPMKLKVLMMQKNEELLLPVWGAFFGDLFGHENIHIFDNGSTNPNVIATLDRLEQQGVHVYRQFNTVEDFARKGDIIAEKIIELDREDPADFYFPLDCDEFLIVQRKGEYSCSRRALETMLAPYRGIQDVMLFGTSFDNYPGKPGSFVRKGRKKCFFAKDTCKYLDLGFHKAKAKRSSESVKARGVWQIHLHNKPFELLKEHAFQKMVGRVESFQPEALIAHREARGKGMHLVDELLLSSEEEYLARAAGKYKDVEIERLQAFEDALERANVKLPY